MAKKIQLTIPKPCHEDWDKMTQADKGRFCGSCQKQVVDFSSMSDRQVAEFFKKPSTGSVCGRFMTDQLDRAIEMPKKRIPWLKYFFQIALPAFFVSKVSAQQPKVGKVISTKGTTAVVIPDNQPAKPDLNSVCHKSAEDTLSPMILGGIAMEYEYNQRGRVVDAETGEPLADVYMEIVTGKDKETALTLQDGSFTFAINRHKPVKNILVSRIGYEMQQIKYSQLQKEPDGTILVKLKSNHPLMLKGEIAVNTCRQPLMGDIDASYIAEKGNTIKGVVVDENDNPVSYASIQAGNVMNFFVADGKGEFEIDKDQLPREKVLSVSAAGFENASAKVEEQYMNGKELKIVLKAKNILPEVVIISSVDWKKIHCTLGAVTIINEKSIKQEIPLHSIGNRELTVYPNPLPSGATINLNLNLKKEEEGYYRLQLISLAGQMMFERQVWIDGDARVFSIEPPAVAAGSYFIALINKQSGKKITEKIVVQ